MKIDNSLKSVPGNNADDNRSTRSSKQASGEAAAPGVNVNLSPLSARLQSLEEGLKNGEVVNAERINEIREAIAEGRFKVNPEVVADRLLATVQELIRAYRA